MKKALVTIAVCAAALTIAGCSVQFNVGTKTNLGTGLKVAWNGLGVDEADLAVGDQALSSNEIDVGAKVVMRLKNVDGFVKKDGKVFPGASMLLKGPKGDVLLDEKDLFASKTDGVPPDPDGKVQLKLTINTGEPMAKGEVYTWSARVWDKNGKGEINANVSLKMR